MWPHPSVPPPRPPIPVRTIYVIETINGVPQSVNSFVDDEKGNNEAEALFQKLFKEHTGEKCLIFDVLDGGYKDYKDSDGNLYSIFLTRVDSHGVKTI
jgi:hypothetical protein